MKLSGRMFQTILGLSFGLLFNSSLMARDVAGISFSEQVSVDGVEKQLSLNGAGIRYKFFFKIYVGALYLPAKQSNADVILKTPQANRVVMHFLYDEVEKEKLVNAWLDGFEDNLESAAFITLKDRLDKFNAMFSNLRKGDVVLLDYIPEQGTRVTIKGEQKGIIKGMDFNQALLSVWLGEEPVTEELKDAMLGVVEEE
ncbi:MAG: chalcone isomerase family protein [Gammaproteobacteria bacterium]|nr:chalcone isomerase family protein [Gammaproteobacteria bacterium]